MAVIDSVKGAAGADQGMAAEELNRLREFRGQVHRRADELFGLTGALLCADSCSQAAWRAG